MINAPRFAFSSGPQTFSLRLDLDPRVVNWHVDHYTRNMKNGSYTLSGLWGGGLMREQNYVVASRGDRLSKMICPNFWGANIHIPESKVRAKIASAWFGLIGLEGEPSNFSLTRYDKLIKAGYSKMGGHYFYTHDLPKTEQILGMFGVCIHQMIENEMRLKCLTRPECGEAFHGRSYDIRKTTASTWL